MLQRPCGPFKFKLVDSDPTVLRSPSGQAGSREEFDSTVTQFDKAHVDWSYAMSDRNRRRCVLRKTAVPDATHYVGYVEDQETPEMIMKKFEEMEKIKAASRRPAQAAAPAAAAAAAAVPADAAGPSGSRAVSEAAAAGSELTALEQQDADIGGEEAPLDQQQLQAIFKATSMYNVKSVLGNNEALMLDAAGKPQPDRGPAASDIAFDSGTLLL